MMRPRVQFSPAAPFSFLLNVNGIAGGNRRSIWRFAADVVTIAVLIIFPEIVLFLPKLLG